jgi:hypothetical protein
MTNKEQIQRDIAIVFDFVEQIIDNPNILYKIPEGTEIAFLDDQNLKPEKSIDKGTVKKYVKVKRHFEVI